MRSIVISLQSALDRRAHIEYQFGSQNIIFDFFDALTPNFAELKAKEMGLMFKSGFLTQGEIACFMSHVSLWQKMIDENIQHLAIFEDDVYLGEHANCYLNQEDWIDHSWDVIKLEAFSKKILHEGRGILVGNGRQLVKLKCRHLGAAGYILSLNAAQCLMSYLTNNEISEPLDHILFDRKFHPENFSLYQMKPAICIQSYLYVKCEDGNFLSCLEKQREDRRAVESKARTFGDRLSRELNRLKQQINTSIFKKPIEFK
ncbi:glycosyltransferase family 25 protein [Acinetobacter sp. 194]|uniref:glycosyltransferase family 25 protein n=1 Tax=Acinetobacter shaoyimingii TaxID=2715164 RepID=UPI00140AFB4E|nr:glycosyltransferase family 25 protein [Acinetobacter shaoyimingii]NHB58728.1 glycosyltransferase family 25 protein [Acinetobacter shaoyimingii]